MNRFQERLLAFALNHFQARETDTGFVLSDSFRELHFHLTRRGYRQGETELRCLRDFRAQLVPPQNLNADGLIQGQLLLEAGCMDFNLKLIRERLSPKTNIHLSLRTTQSTMFGGVTYESIHCSAYEQAGYFVWPCHVAQRQGQSYTHELTDTLRTFLHHLCTQAMSTLLTPSARVQIEIADARKRLAAKEQEIAKAMREQQAISLELQALQQGA